MSSKDFKVDEDVMAFIVESREILEDVEPQIITLGQRLDEGIPSDDDTINYIFRAFHTIKGTAAFYQLDNVVGVTHKAETLLEVFRQGIVEIDTSCTDLLCRTCDTIEDLFVKIEETGSDKGSDENVKSINSRLTGLTNLLSGRGVEEVPEDVGTGESPAGHADQKTEHEKKLNTNGRIFLTECRPYFGDVHFEVEKIAKMNGDTLTVNSTIITTCLEKLKIIEETADFLEFDHSRSVFHKLIDLLETVEENESVITKKDSETLISLCNTIKALFLTIEQEGNEAGYELNETIPDDNDDIYQGGRQDEEARSEDENEPLETFTISNAMKDTFFDESIECLDMIEDVFLKMEPGFADMELLGEAFRLLHSFKGSCGFMNYGDLEMLAHKTETLIEAALDGILILDDWDMKAVWFVLGVMRETVEKIAGNDSERILNIAVLVYMLEYITTFLDSDEKFAEMLLPKIEKPRPPELILEKVETSNQLNKQPSTKAPIEQGTIDALLEAEGLEKVNKMKPNKEKTNTVEEKGAEKAKLFRASQSTIRKQERRDIRVSLDKLDELINLIGELVIAENMVIRNPDVVNRELENFDKASIHLSKIVRDLQDVALSVRMIPISGVFRKMIRLVHDLSAKSNKKVGLQLIGEDTEIDKTVAELIADPLVHLVRNAVDHGITINKNRTKTQNDGNIVLEARHEGGEVWILIKDDGGGLDREKILQKGIESGLVSENGKQLSEQDITELIFQPGISTSDIVTAVSGRGVGMDVVKKNIEKIKGHIDIHSRPGYGTTFIMRIPLTLAIIDGMLVRVGEASYTVPLLSIRESIQIEEEQITVTMDGQEMVKVRDELIPVIRLHRLYNLEADYYNLHEGLLVIVEHQRETACLFIDEIIGEQQTVIKGLTGYMEGVRGVSGCTILGDGEVSLILDVAGLIKRTHSDDFSYYDSPSVAG